MLKHRVDSIKEKQERENAELDIREELELATDGIAELGVLIAQLREAQEGGSTDDATE